MQPMVPVIVNGCVLFSARGISAIPEEKRAGIIARNVKTAVSASTFPVEDLAINENGYPNQNDGPQRALCDERLNLDYEVEA